MMGAAGRSRIEYRYALPLVLIRMAGIYKRHLPVRQTADIADKQTAVGQTAVGQIADKQTAGRQTAASQTADRQTAVEQIAVRPTASTGVQRILHVVVNLNRGGAETLLMNLYRNVDRSRVQFDFLTCKPGVFDEEIVALGGVIHRIPYLTEVGHRGFVRALRVFFRDHPDYTIVHSHLDKMSGIVLTAARREGVQVRIAHSHNTASEGGAPARLYKWAVGLLIRRSATHKMACSQAAAEWLFPRRTADALVLHNGIEIDRFQHRQEVREEVRRELAIPADTFVIGHVGRFAPVKNHSYLLELYRRFRAEHPAALLLLSGDGPLLAQMQEQAARAGLTGEHVRFLGSRSDVDHLLQAMDVFVFPSLHEGLPVVLIEAQGAALPCLVSTAVSPESDLGLSLVRQLPLADQTHWLRELQQLAASRKPRTTQAMSIAAAGYDIRQTASWLTGYYLTITQGRKRDEEADCLYADVQPRILPGSVLRKLGAADPQRFHLAGYRRRLDRQYPRVGRAVGSRSED
jgi:glycosyltransferase involved in cell wall biosynthesis